MANPERTADSSAEGAAPAAEMLRMVNGYQLSQALYVAAALGIADLLADRAMTSSELAEATSTHAPSLYRLLRALASRGIFMEADDRAFQLTPLAALLREDAPGSLRASVLDVGESLYRVWGALDHSVRTGENAFAAVFGMPSWRYRGEHREANARYNRRMAEGARLRGAALVTAYDFVDARTVVDVGGGDGTLLTAVLRAHPSVRGILFDQPHVIAGAGSVLDAAGVGGRCEVVGGDFFQSVPAGGDRYILSTVLHDWDDERATAILRRCRQAIDTRGRLLVVEAIVPPGNEPHPSKFGDLHMLVMHAGGRERTEPEWHALLTAGRFSPTTVVPLSTGHVAIEAAPA